MNTKKTSKIVLGAKANKSVICSSCKSSISAGKQYTYKGKDGSDVYFCAKCREQINNTLVQETKDIKFFRTFLGGLIGAFLGGLGWYLISFLTGYEIGYVAIGVGYLVVKGISVGSGNKRGPKLQIMGIILTLVAIMGANLFLAAYYIGVELAKQHPQAPQWKINFASLMGAGETFFSYAISPIGLLIWGIALYVVYNGLKASKI